jgi:hypothetical protein
VAAGCYPALSDTRVETAMNLLLVLWGTLLGLAVLPWLLAVNEARLDRAERRRPLR